MAEKKIAKEKKAKETTVVPVHTNPEKTFAVRGNIFVGKVVSAKAQKTVTVERELTHYLQKYERYKKIKTKIAAHNPTSINAKEGDTVEIGETRKISKTKNFTVIRIVHKAGDKQ